MYKYQTSFMYYKNNIRAQYILTKQVHLLNIAENMNRNEITHILRTSNLGIDTATLEQTLGFITDHVGRLDPLIERYQIMAAAAIVGETIVLDDITNTRRAKSGITLELVMRHLGALSKEQYLEVLSRQVERWRQVPLWLKAKAENLRITYRIYKKYRTALQQLSATSVLLDEKGGFNLMATFWLVFLFLKNQNSEFDNTLVSTSLLHAIVVFAFAEVAAQMPHQKSSSEFRRQFPESKLPTGAEWERLRRLILGKLEEAHAYRHQEKAMELQQLVTNPIYEQRFLDDLSNLYEKFRITLPENIIDEHSFLELTKNIAPQPVRRMIPEATGCIQTRIDFSKSDDEDDQMQDEKLQDPPQQQRHLPVFKNPFEKSLPKEEPRNVPISPIRSLDVAKGAATPVTARHRNLSWVNGIIAGKYVEEEAMRVQQLYHTYARKDYGIYKNNALLSITNAIVEFTPDCMDVPRRQRSIYHFFEYFINRIAESHVQTELAAIIGEDLNISSILCLSCQLFNYAYHSLSGAYRSYCRLFGVTLLQGYKPVNWFGKHVRMPRNIEDYLYDLERRILIEQLWEENDGYELLTNMEELHKYHNQAVLKRLHKHASERTQELCQMMQIGEKEIMRVVNLVKLILDKRPILLKNHRIDQMVVCSIASTLSINCSSFQLSLEQIFENYNKLILSFNANRHSLYDYEGNQIGLVDFYNAVFLPCVEDLLSDSDHHDFLATPVRLERTRSRQFGIEMTPISIKFRQPPTLVVPSRKITLQSSEEKNRKENQWGMTNSYRYQLASSLKNLDQFPDERDEQDMEESPTSPTFGGSKAPDIYRTFSFGDRDGKF